MSLQRRNMAQAYKKPKKMDKEALARRKRSTISNAAGKTMGGLFSK